MSNEIVIEKLDEAHKYLNGILIELIQAGASHNTLHEFISAQQRINDCYINDDSSRMSSSPFGGGIVMGPMMQSPMSRPLFGDVRFGNSVAGMASHQSNNASAYREQKINELIDIISHFDFTNEEKLKLTAVLELNTNDS